MLRLLALLCAASLALAPGAASAGSLALLGVGSAPSAGGGGNSLALDGTGQTLGTSGASATVALTTTHPTDVVTVISLANAGQVSSITAAGLTFTKRASAVNTGGEPIEEWSAVASATFSGNITVNYSNTTTYASVVAFGISGANTGTIYDNHTGLPATASGTVSISTANANDFLIGTYRYASTVSPTAGSGWTQIAGGGYLLVEYRIVSATQSSLAVTDTTGAGDEGAGIGDAVISQ